MPTRARRALAASGLVAAVFLTGCGDDDETTSDPSTTDTTSVVTSTTSTTTTTPTATTSTTTAVTTLGPVPSAVTAITAGPGGGSGEIALNWDAVAGATGYRVERSDAPGGPFTVAADVDLATGAVTVADGVVNLWAPGSTNFHPTLDFEVGDPLPPEYEYIEIGGTQPRYFHVVAYNDAGDGAPSVVVCGTTPGGVSC